MKQEYASQYTSLYHNHWWWRARERVLLDMLASILEGTNNRILDIGCGDGLFFPELQQFGTVTGFELPQHCDSQGPFAHQIVTTSLDDQEKIPDGSFDLVLLLDVIEHLEDEAVVLEPGVRKLAKGGSILITVPAYQSLWTSHDEDNHHFRRYSPAQLKAVLADYGLTEMRFGGLFGWTALIKWVASRYESIRKREFRGSNIPHPIINKLLTEITYLESKIWLATGCRIGSSLFYVGKRT